MVKARSRTPPSMRHRGRGGESMIRATALPVEADRKFKRPFHAAPLAGAACNPAAHGGVRSGRGDEERRDKAGIAFVQGTPAAGGQSTLPPS